MDVVNPRCAGLDVHKRGVTVCILLPGKAGKPAKEIRSFGTMTDDLLKLSDWLAANQITCVAMESTGVYWKPLVRHEALSIREGMREPLRETVAAVSRS